MLKVLSASRTGEAVWVPLDRQAVQVNSDAAAIAVGATGWGRPEDIEISTSSGSTKGGNIMYVATTSEDLVLRIELKGDEAYVSNFVQEGVNVMGLNNPDNLALDNQGNVYVVEDNGPGDIFIARVKSGNERVAQDVARFASLSDCAGEPTGLYFDRNGKTAWVHVQHAGGTLRNDLLVAIEKEKATRVDNKRRGRAQQRRPCPAGSERVHGYAGAMRTLSCCRAIEAALARSLHAS